MKTLDNLLLGIGRRLLRSKIGAVVVRYANASLSRIAPHTPRHEEVPPERARARVPVEVRASTIPGAGLGLFAAERVESGVIIGEYTGDQVKSIFDVLRMRNLSYLALDDPSIDASNHPEVVARYVCHHPLAERRNVDFSNEEARLYLKTTKAVDKGDEFFIDYGFMYWAIHGIEPAGD